MVTALDTIGADYTEQRIKLPVHRLLVSEFNDFVTKTIYYSWHWNQKIKNKITHQITWISNN